MEADPKRPQGSGFGAGAEDPAQSARLARWTGLLRTGGSAALGSVALIVVQLVVFIVWPPVHTVVDVFGLMNENPVLGLLSMDVLLLVNNLLTWLLYLGLGVVLWPVSRSAVTLVVGLGTLQMAAYTASNPALDLLTLARLHAAAAPDERAALAAAGEAVLARWNGTAFVTYYLLGAVVLLILAWLLRRSGRLQPGHRSLGAGGRGADAGAFLVRHRGMVLALASLVPWSVLCVMAGRRLLGLAGCRLGIGRRDLPGPR